MMGFCFAIYSPQLLCTHKPPQDTPGFQAPAPSVCGRSRLLSGIYYTYLYSATQIIQTLPVLVSHRVNQTTGLLPRGNCTEAPRRVHGTQTRSVQRREIPDFAPVSLRLPPPNPTTTSSLCPRAFSEPTPSTHRPFQGEMPGLNSQLHLPRGKKGGWGPRSASPLLVLCGDVLARHLAGALSPRKTRKMCVREA